MNNLAKICILVTLFVGSIDSASVNTSVLTKIQNSLQIVISDLTKVKQENRQLQDEVDELNKERVTRNGICEIKNQPCGNCFCVEDYSLMEKYFCDCRARPIRRDCKEHYVQGERINGLYKVNKNIPSAKIQVYCDQKTDGGGWTVVQRRLDGSENFFRNWTEYKVGFGKLHKEHWLGNQNLHYLTSQAFYTGSEVRFDLQVKGESIKRWAKYSSFSVGNEKSGFVLHVAGITGSNINNQMPYNNGMKFTTYDRDHDIQPDKNCAYTKFGAWWHKYCSNVNINGQYDRYDKQGAVDKVVGWYPYRLTYSEMKVRRK